MAPLTRMESGYCGVDSCPLTIENLAMPWVRVEPTGLRFECATGDTVMEGANAAGYYWPEGCPRNGECTNCAMGVIAGIGRLSPMGRYERANLVRQRGRTSVEDPRLRLACQAHVEGDIVVTKRGVEALA